MGGDLVKKVLSTAYLGDNALGPSIRLSVHPLPISWLNHTITSLWTLYVCNQKAYADNLADEVDQLLI